MATATSTLTAAATGSPLASNTNISKPHTRKRKRRRPDKPAITGRLVLDDHIKGDVGILSEDLFADLFPVRSDANSNGNGSASTNEVHHVAICPWIPSSAIEDSSWTLVPVQPSSALAHSTIQFSPASVALQNFTEALQRVAPSKINSHSRSGIEIKILDVVPLTLDTLFVTIESDLAKRLANGEGTFHGDHVQQQHHYKTKALGATPEDKLTVAIREALGSLKIVHNGDFFPLPLPPHPITHALAQPARVTLCEPVGQGSLGPNTKIIVTQTGHHTKTTRKPQAFPVNRALAEVTEEDEDTANDDFYSAAEDRYKTDAVMEDESMTETETELSGLENDDDDLSDDSMDEMISLQVPMLSARSVSGVSTLQPGTPHTIGLGRKTNGISTPGSVFSNFTATTARAGGQRGRLFKAQGLLKPLAEELLHPKPGPEDDEEARIFVDINSLTKIGCFSGDWVRLEAAAEPPAGGAGLWGLGSFGAFDQEESVWRPVKVFGLPESYAHRSVTKIPSQKQDGRKLSFFESQVQKSPSPTVYLSPVLLANMENTPYCRLSALKSGPQLKGQPTKITPSSRPPFARELTLLKISTPFSTERVLQNALFTGLKQHFAKRTRVVRKGDLVAIPVDADLGRTLYQPAASDDLDMDDFLSNSAPQEKSATNSTKPTGVAWFKIGYVGVSKENTAEDMEDVWAGTASIDASSTRMMQSGSESSRLPATMDSLWEFYLGLKSMAKSELEITSMPEPRKHHVPTLQRRLRELVAAATSPRAIHLNLQPLAILLVSTQRNIGKATLAHRASADIGLHTFEIDAYDILSEGGAGSDVKTAGLLEARAERAMSCGPEFCTLLIRHVEALTADRMAASLKGILGTARVLIATTTEVDKVPDGLRGLFSHELEMTAPDEWEREGILRSILDDQPVPLAPEVDLSSVAVKTAALVAGDLVDVADRALVARNLRLDALVASATTADTLVTMRDVLVAGGSSGRCLTKVDFDFAVEAARKNFADAIGAPKIPNVGWDDVGGLNNVKDAVMETIQLPLERPELFAKGMKKRSGILFYGPPGTGKTLLAKAIATEFSLNFFSVKGPELLNMYIGESEANVRRVFQRARDARPCVVFFDELDSVAPKRGNQGDSGGVMDRIVSQLLAELDGMSDGDDGGGGVFVIGATNRPDLLDAALLRPGRFDKMLYLGVSDTHEKQLTIIEALTRKFTLHPSLSLPRVASRLPFTYTGADFYALCTDAMLKAVTRQASMVDNKIKEMISSTGTAISTAYFFDHHAQPEDVAVMVTENDFLEAERELVPSVSFKELEHYKHVRAMFEKAAEGEENGEKGEAEPARLNSSGSGMNGDGNMSTASAGAGSGSGGSIRGKSRLPSGNLMDRKGKGKERVSSGSLDRGRQRAIINGDEAEVEDDSSFWHDDDGYAGHGHDWKGKGAGKGKGKEVAGPGGSQFEEGMLEDEEDLY